MNHLGISLKFGRFRVEIEFLHLLTGFKVWQMPLVHEPHFEQQALEIIFIGLVNYIKDGFLCTHVLKFHPRKLLSCFKVCSCFPVW